MALLTACGGGGGGGSDVSSFNSGKFIDSPIEELGIPFEKFPIYELGDSDEFSFKPLAHENTLCRAK